MSNGGTPRDKRRGQPARQHEPASQLTPSDHDYHDHKQLIAGLTSLNGQASRYVLRYLDADAGRAVPTSPDDELLLGERMVALGEALQARAERRLAARETNGSVVESDEQA